MTMTGFAAPQAGHARAIHMGAGAKSVVIQSAHEWSENELVWREQRKNNTLKAMIGTNS